MVQLVPFFSLGVRRTPKRTRDAPSATLTDGASIKLSHVPYAPSRRNGADRWNSVLKPRTVMELNMRKELVGLVVASFLPIGSACLEVAVML